MTRALGVALLCLVLCGCGPRAASGTARVGEPFPDLELGALWPGEAGTRLSAYRGRLVVLNLWAPWCAPCVEEMPRLQRLHERLDGRRFAVIGATVDERFLAQEFLRDKSIDFPNFFVERRRVVTRRLGVHAFPVTFIIATDGVLLARVVGWREWDTSDSMRRLRRLYQRRARLES
ncbi:MAG TPA: TlpA family protein disulfide reductase [Gammaproteobacteria bacterium]|nr:TlpA family protein disulfide reductase [Gammaproteobacteria bacterium]